MRKVYKVFLIILLFIFLSTLNPNSEDLVIKKKNNFFNIKNIIITNNNLINEKIITKKLKNIFNKNIFLIKKNDIKKPLKDINFLNKVEVKKQYPETIIVKIFETKPIGILYKDKSKYFVDNFSNLISFQEFNNSNFLPSIFGENAEKDFLNFFNELKKNKFMISEVESYYYFQVGRWDIKLKNSKIIKFPEINTTKAIKKSLKLLKREDFNKYNIIDLRVDGKIVVNQ